MFSNEPTYFVSTVVTLFLTQPELIVFRLQLSSGIYFFTEFPETKTSKRTFSTKPLQPQWSKLACLSLPPRCDPWKQG